MKVDAIEPSVCGTNLVLRADCLLKQVLLDVNRIGGKGVLIAHLFFERIKTKEKTNGKRRARTQTSSSGQISHMMNFDALLNARELQARTHRRVFNLAIADDIFNSRIGNAAVIFEKRGQMSTSNVAAFVYRGRQYSAAVLSVPDRIIGTATKE